MNPLEVNAKVSPHQPRRGSPSSQPPGAPPSWLGSLWISPHSLCAHTGLRGLRPLKLLSNNFFTVNYQKPQAGLYVLSRQMTFQFTNGLVRGEMRELRPWE